MNDLKKISHILASHLDFNYNKVFMFGSRVKMTHRIDSDLDLLIDDTTSIAPSLISYLRESFENSDLLYKVDIVLKSQISDEFFYKIKNDLVEIKY